MFSSLTGGNDGFVPPAGSTFTVSVVETPLIPVYSPTHAQRPHVQPPLASYAPPQDVPRRLFQHPLDLYPITVYPAPCNFHYQTGERSSVPDPELTPLLESEVFAPPSDQIEVPVDARPNVIQLTTTHRIDTGSGFANLLSKFPNAEIGTFRNVVDCAKAFQNHHTEFKELTLEQCGISDVDFSCQSLSSLRKLTLRCCGLEGALTANLLSHLPQLEYLEVEGIFKTFLWNGGLSHDRLETLILSNAHVGNQGDAPIFSLLTKLKTLILNGVKGIRPRMLTSKGALPRSLQLFVVHMCRSIREELVLPEEVAAVAHVAPYWMLMQIPNPGRPARQVQVDAAARANELRMNVLKRLFQLPFYDEWKRS